MNQKTLGKCSLKEVISNKVYSSYRIQYFNTIPFLRLRRVNGEETTTNLSK